MKITIELGSIDEIYLLRDWLNSIPNVDKLVQRKCDTPIEALGLSPRAYQSLKAENIRTIGDIATWSESGLLGLVNLGRKSLNEIRDTLAALGVSLSSEYAATCRRTAP